MIKAEFQHHYASLQCHVIFRNNSDLLLNKHLWLLSMLKTVVIFIFVDIFSVCFDEYKVQMNSISFESIIFNIIYAFTDTIGQFNALSVNKSINLLKMSY